MGKYVRNAHFLIYIRKTILLYDFATAPLWISDEENLIFFFISVMHLNQAFYLSRHKKGNVIQGKVVKVMHGANAPMLGDKKN